MEIVECIIKKDMYIHKLDDGALNFEKEIGLIEISNAFEFAFSVGCNRLYYKTTKYKLLYPDCNYNDAWNYVKSVHGLITSVETNFDAIMNDENIQNALGNVRINRLNFDHKILTNGKNCDSCIC